MRFIYLDTSAFLRGCLDGADDHAAALGLLMSEPRRLISSELLGLEADRAAVRIASEQAPGVDAPTIIRNALRRVNLVTLDHTIINAARAIPQVVKSLDAIHLATAEWLGEVIDCMVTTVARQRGLTACTAAALALAA